MNIIKPIFKEPSYQALFDKQGFVVVPFIDRHDIDHLNDLFDEMHTTLPVDGGFVSGSHSGDFGYKKKASDAIVQVFSKQYERIFQNYQTFGAAFLYKMPSENSELSIHQDWSIVDEDCFVALNCWVPLVDIDANNGALHVLPGSQYGAVIKTIRSPTMDFFFTGYDHLAMQVTEPMYVPAGHAVILNQSVVHFSPTNRSGKVRKAITAGVKSAGAPMVFYYSEKGRSDIEVYEMPEDFLISFDKFNTDIQQRPKIGSIIGTKKYQKPIFDEQAILALFHKMRLKADFDTMPVANKERKGFFSRLTAVFQ